MNATDIICLLNKVACTKSRTEKEELLGRCKDDALLQAVFRYAYDPFITYGVTPPKCEGTAGGPGIGDFGHWSFALLDALRARKVTGNAAKEQIKEMLLTLDPDSSELMQRILKKDLRAGFTANTINKIMPGFIDVFEVMLAHKFEEKRIKAFPIAAEPKLDGTRVAAIVEDGQTAVLSRNGKEFPGLAHLSKQIYEVVAAAHAKAQEMGKGGLVQYLGGEKPRVMLDGEAISGNFNETVGSVRRKSEAGDAILHVFDVLPLVPFRSLDAIKAPYKTRRTILEFLVKAAPVGAPVKIVPRYLCNSVEEIMALYERVRATPINGKPGEGLIVKPLDAFYEKKRSHAWLKIKAEESEDLPVVGAFEGTGKYEGMLGGLIVKRENGVEVKVGGGFSDDQRKELWAAWLRDKEVLDRYSTTGETFTTLEVWGRLIEVEFHEETPDGSLRHPRFVRFRDDKAVQAEAAE